MINASLSVYIAAVCLFFSASSIFLLDLKYGSRELFIAARKLFLAGFVALSAHLLWTALVNQYLPLFTFHETVLLFAWSAALLLLLLERRFSFRSVFYFSSPLLFLVVFFAFFFSAEQADLAPELKSIWLYTHIIMVMVAYSAFAVAFVTSMMYLLVDQQLKKKKLSALVTKLPNLSTLDQYNHTLVAIGFFLLTVSILLGALWAQNVWGQYWRWEPKEIWSVITWIIYAIYLHTRLLSGWQGRKVALLNSIGFATALFNYVVVRFFFASGMHVFY